MEVGTSQAPVLGSRWLDRVFFCFCPLKAVWVFQLLRTGKRWVYLFFFSHYSRAAPYYIHIFISSFVCIGKAIFLLLAPTAISSSLSSWCTLMCTVLLSISPFWRLLIDSYVALQPTHHQWLMSQRDGLVINTKPTSTWELKMAKKHETTFLEELRRV